MKRWEELIRKNVFRLGGHWDHLSASLAHMLYYIVVEEQYKLAYFFVKRIECAWATSTANLPYDMFLTRLYRHVMEHYPHLNSGIYNVVDRVMRDDDEDVGVSRASTPSPTTYLNFLRPLNYQRYDIPTSSQQDDDLLFERQTALLDQSQQIHKEVRGGFKSFRKALQ
nr:ribosomal protein L7Ae/L30e/S12e/Gadd45 [Tanacetum cinerariifolium]